jgi:hypothetical protein
MTTLTTILLLTAAYAALLLLNRLSTVKDGSDRLLTEYSKLLAEARETRRQELAEEDELFNETPSTPPSAATPPLKHSAGH